MQMSASGVGEWGAPSRLEKMDEAAAAGFSPATATAEGKVAMFC